MSSSSSSHSPKRTSSSSPSHSSPSAPNSARAPPAVLPSAPPPPPQSSLSEVFVRPGHHNSSIQPFDSPNSPLPVYEGYPDLPDIEQAPYAATYAPAQSSMRPSSAPAHSSVPAPFDTDAPPEQWTGSAEGWRTLLRGLLRGLGR